MLDIKTRRSLLFGASALYFGIKSSIQNQVLLSDISNNYLSLVDIRKNWLKKLYPETDIFEKIKE